MSKRLARRAIATIAVVVVVAAPSALSAETVTSGPRTLTTSRAANLDAAGEAVRVTGSGYDTFKGVYVAYCVIPPPGQPPSPCGGGADLSGAAGGSHWISSNPPPYGVGVAIPYGPGGTFDVTINVTAMLNPTTDCRVVRCGIVTRNDHVRSSDRSQDLFVPVSFAAPSAPPAPAPAGGTGAPGAQAWPGPTPDVPHASLDANPSVDEPTPTPTDPAPGSTASSSTTAPVARPEEVAVANDELASASTEAAGSGGGGGVTVALVVLAALALGAGVGGIAWRRRQRA